MTSPILSLLSKERLHRHYRDGFWRDDTLYALMKATAERSPEKAALRDRERRLSYGELCAAVERLAADLTRRGVRPGQRVAVWLPSRIETAIAMLACARNGFVCCPSLHRDHTVGEIINLLDRIRAAALLVQPGYGADADRRDIVAEAHALPSLRHIYSLAPPSAAAPFDGLLSDGTQDGTSTASGDPDQIMYLAFTSGTSGVPKGVLHSDNTLLATVWPVATDWHLDADTVIYTLSPLSHNLGMGALIAAIAVGGELVVHDLLRQHSLLDRLVETGATYLIGVPTHAIDILREMRARGLKQLGAVKGFRISGASAPREIIAGLLEAGVVPQSGYGMTETCSHQYTLPGDDPRLILESVGRACAGYELRIWRQDDPDCEAPVGEIGQIGGRGASLMLGYFDDQRATEESFNRDGWFMTGDLGWMDAEGYLRITGRKKEIIIRGGHNIYPARIESLALRHEGVERAAAVPVADERFGEKVCLAIMVRPGVTLSGEDMLGHLDAAGLSKFDMPEYFLAVPEIPLTSSGKVLKRELVARIESGALQPEPVRWTAKSGSEE